MRKLHKTNLVRQFVGLLLLALLGLLAGIETLKLRTRLSLNKAIYLTNQHQWKEAEKQLKRVRALEPANEEVLRQYAHVLVAQMRYAEALTVLKKVPVDAETSFAQGVCEFELGNESSAKASFVTAMKANGLPVKLKKLASVAASGFEESMDVDGKAGDASEYAPYPLLLLSFGGRAMFNAGNFAMAATLLQEALRAGDLNPDTRSYSVAAFAAAGNFSQAEYLADYGALPETLLRARALALRQQEDLETQSISLKAASYAAETSASLQRAQLWTEKHALDTTATAELEMLASRTLALISQDNEDLQTSLLYGEILEKSGRDREAFQHYAQMMQSRPTYVAKLRMDNISGNKMPGTAIEFLSQQDAITYVPSTAMSTTNTMMRDSHVAFFSRSSATAIVELPSEGSYEVGLVARGDRAFGLWPVCTILIDGQVAGRIYVNRDSWECYSVVAKLPAGKREIKLEYTNNSDRLLSAEEDRNLYVAGVLVSNGAQ